MYTPEFWKWVEEHRGEDSTKLRLKTRGAEPWIEDAIAQIENERRSQKKFAADGPLAEAMPRLMPVGISIEQATSARVAMLHRSIAEKLLPENPRILDMTCGLGVDASVLATIPGAHVTAIELDGKIAGVARTNYATRPEMSIIEGDSTEFLRECKQHFDLIFIDPARRDSVGNRVYNIRDCAPNVIDLMPLLLAKSDHLMIKLSPMLDVTQTIRDLPGLTDLYIIDDGGECRELLAVVGKEDVAEPMIHSISGDIEFSFTKREESEAEGRYELPRAGQYLLEPSPALMKAGAFRLTGRRFGIAELHPNTHLFISDTTLNDFPGRSYLITEVLPFSSSNIKRLKKERLEADVAVRNFPFTAEQLRGRLGVRKSGPIRIVGVTAADGNPYMILSRKPTVG